MRNAETVLGIIRSRRDTGEPGAPKGARPVRGGADGKVLTEQLVSRLLYLAGGAQESVRARAPKVVKVGVRAWRTALSVASSRQPHPSKITSITGRRTCIS